MINEFLIVLIALVVLLKMKAKIFKVGPNFKNKRVLITGASSGIG